jgi:hypothetical protein
MSLIMRKDLIVKKLIVLIMSPFGLIIIIRTMSPAHCARNTMRATMRATISLIVGLIVGENIMRATMRLIVVRVLNSALSFKRLIHNATPTYASQSC